MKQAYESGMYIRYGGTGICLIDRIEEVPYPGTQPMRLCYILKPIRNAGMEISVPLDNETLCARMQPIRTREEIDRMLDDAVNAAPPEWIDDRKQRGAAYKQILISGDAPSLLRMIHGILLHQAAFRSAGRRLSAMDDNARKDAAKMLNEEFGFSLGMKPEEASAYICDRLNRE